MAHPGSWLGLPDYGITENINNAIAKILGVQPAITPQGGSQLVLSPFSQSDRSQVSNAVQNSTYGSSGPTNFKGVTDTISPQNPLRPTGGGSGGNVVNPTNNIVSGGQNAADLAYRAAIGEANSIRDRGRQTFQNLLDSVNRFRDRSLEQKNTGDQQIVNTAAETLGSNAKTAQQLAGTANAQGRNLGLSSKVNLGQKILGNLEGTQGSTLATKGTNLSNNQNLYNQRLDQAQASENKANDYLKQVEDSASNVALGGVSNYANNLQAVVDRANALASLNPLNANGLSGYTPDFSGITNTLNGLVGSIPAVGAGAGNGTGGINAGNLFNDPTFQAYLKKNIGLYTG